MRPFSRPAYRGSATLDNVDPHRSREPLEVPHRETLELQVGLACATAFIVASLGVYYALVGHDGLPIGWDTPHYIGGAIVFAVQGPGALVSLLGAYDFVYQMLLGVFVWAGIPGTSVEIFLPIVLAGSIPYLFAKFSLANLHTRAALFVALTTPAWSAVYRLQADLHANLFALVLFICALSLLSRARLIRDRYSLSGLALIALASFTHIESTLFLVAVTSCSSLTKLRPFPFKLVLGMIAIIIPATFFFILHVLQLLVSSGGTLAFSSQQTFDSWILILGPLLPLTAFGLVWSSLRPRSWLEIFASVWGIASLVLGLSQYISPQTVNFAQRAVILTPTPLLAGLGALRLREIVASFRTVRVPVRYLRVGAIAGIFIILALSWPIASVSVASEEKIYLTSLQNQQLSWVSANVKFTNTPIFMFNDVDQYAGGLAQLYDSWVSAKIGPHLPYLGLTDYLVRLEETPYSDLNSRTVEDLFMQQILAAGINTKTALLQHPIVILSGFYRPIPLPNYTSPLFSQVSPGVFIDNATSLNSPGNVTLPLYTIFGAHSGTWYGTPASWAESGYSYDVLDSLVPNVQASFLFRVQVATNYTVGLRYWDSIGNNFTLAVDGQVVGTISYDQANGPALRYFSGVSLSQGIHTLTIVSNNAPTVNRRYASLDYFTLLGS